MDASLRRAAEQVQAPSRDASQSIHVLALVTCHSLAMHCGLLSALLHQHLIWDGRAFSSRHSAAGNEAACTRCASQQEAAH